MSELTVEEKIKEKKIIAVTVFKKEEEVRPTVEALLEGGVEVMELALRSPYSLRAAELTAAAYPEFLLGIGTVIEPSQVRAVHDLGADFAVAPGLNRRVIEEARRIGLPFFPGVTTASEIESALEYGIRLLKFFPAEAAGGLAYLKNMNAPYAHLGLKYIPLGGVNPSNLSGYLGQKMIGAVGGSWIASRKLIEEKKWKVIMENAKNAVMAGGEAQWKVQ